MTDLKTIDPKGLFADSYAIDGIDEGQCRSIFLDWAIGVPAGVEARSLIADLHAHFAPIAPDHPMTKVLAEGMAKTAKSGRRGGRRGRIGS